VKAAWAIPILFAVFGGLRVWSLLRTVGRSMRYVERLEKYFAAEGVGGWQHYLNSSKIRGYSFELITAFWVALALITIGVAAAINLGYLHTSSVGIAAAMRAR
jgi:hypothetical protein